MIFLEKNFCDQESHLFSIQRKEEVVDGGVFVLQPSDTELQVLDGKVLTIAAWEKPG